MSGGDSPKRQKISPVSQTGEKKGGKGMRCYHGVWYYQGKQYSSLHEALVAIWPNK